MDACYRSAKSGAWEPVELSSGAAGRRRGSPRRARPYEGYVVIKDEVLPDGRRKLILKDPATGDYVDRVIAGA